MLKMSFKKDPTTCEYHATKSTFMTSMVVKTIYNGVHIVKTNKKCKSRI